MSASTRVFCATLVALFLLALGVHCAWQRQSAEAVDRMVHALEQQHGWHVEEARLHMLRGALALRGLEVREDGWRLLAPYVLLRGHFAERLSQVRLSEWHMQRGEVHLSWKRLSFRPGVPLQALPSPWREVFSSLRRLHAEDVDLYLHRSWEGGGPVLRFRRGHLRWRRDAGEEQWFASSQGPLGLWQWRGKHGQVRIDWQDVNASEPLAFLTAVVESGDAGRLKGHAIWQGHAWNGDLSWRLPGHSVGRMAWQGVLPDEKNLRLVIHGVHWPLRGTSWSGGLLAGCEWREGTVDGTVRIRRLHGRWSLRSDELWLRGMRAVDAFDGETCLQAERLHLRGVNVQWPEEKALYIDRLQAENGRWRVNNGMRASAMEGEGSWREGRVHGSFHGWRLVGDDAFSQMRDLYGTLEWTPDTWSLQARSMPPLGAMAPRWELSAHKGEKRGERFRFRLQGWSVPLSVFRSLLPKRLTDGAELGGQVALSWRGSLYGAPDGAYWTGEGMAETHHLSWQHDGWQARCQRLVLDAIRYDGRRWHLGDIEVGRWSLLAPLAPLSDGLASEEPWKPFWLAPWSVDRLRMQEGRFSIGWSDPAWARIDPLQVRDLHPGSSIELDVSGELLAGALQADVRWWPWDPPGRLEARLRLRDALPFAANPWLLQSDLPDFIRGRLDMDLRVASPSADDPYAYEGIWRVKLKHADLAQGVQQSESFVRAVGRDPRLLLQALTHQGVLRVDIPLQGDWREEPLRWSLLGHLALQELRRRAEEISTEEPSPKRKPRHTLAYVRLHGDTPLWPNERARARKVIRILRKDPSLVLELVPQLGRRDRDAQTIADIRHTQALLEAYIHAAGIARERILPLWPQSAHQAGGEAGIRMQVYAAY